jgi:hypothetical protein
MAGGLGVTIWGGVQIGHAMATMPKAEDFPGHSTTGVEYVAAGRANSNEIGEGMTKLIEGPTVAGIGFLADTLALARRRPEDEIKENLPLDEGDS